MYTNSKLEIIQDHQPYTDSKGVKYPRNFPKSEIAELHKVKETPTPNGDNLIIEGFYIDKTYTQVWNVRKKTPEELSIEATSLARNELNISDKDMARVNEDLVEVLITKGVLDMTDLPQTAQDKITKRKNLRSIISKG